VKQQAEGQKQEVDRDSVKTLAEAVGVREAARRLNLNENTLLSWSKRDNWNMPQRRTNQRNQPAIKPSDSLRDSLADDSKATRIGFSRAARKVAQHVSEAPVNELISPATALSASKWHGVAESIHQWNAEAKGSGVLPGLNIYSEQTVVQVGS